MAILLNVTKIFRLKKTGKCGELDLSPIFERYGLSWYVCQAQLLLSLQSEPNCGHVVISVYSTLQVAIVHFSKAFN